MNFKNTTLAVLISSVLLVQGCASLTEGTTQQVAINNLPESGCQVGEAYVTPYWNKIYVDKANEGLTVVCKDETKVIESEVSSKALLGALLLDFGIVDTLTGAMWKYPQEVDYESLPNPD